MCRGEGWQNEPWPLVRGKKTLEECSEVCKNRKGCTAFEIGPPKKKDRYKCVLYGHDEIQVANSPSLTDHTCYRLVQISRQNLFFSQKLEVTNTLFIYTGFLEKWPLL